MVDPDKAGMTRPLPAQVLFLTELIFDMRIAAQNLYLPLLRVHTV
jgi:hypothetical protein